VELFKLVDVEMGFLSWLDGEMEISAMSVYRDFAINQDMKNAG